MPIAASMGGNAGTQSLTVAVRAIAMRDLTSANAWRVLSKEGFGRPAERGPVRADRGTRRLGLVGRDLHRSGHGRGDGRHHGHRRDCRLPVDPPFCLSRTAIDPAVASGVLLTTITDAIAFLAFLGLAAWWLL